jgi:hypothetical protein
LKYVSLEKRGQSTAGRKRLDEVDQAPQGDRDPECDQQHDQPPARRTQREEQEPHRHRLDDAVEQDGRTRLDIGRAERRQAGQQQQHDRRTRGNLQSIEAPQPAGPRARPIDRRRLTQA